MAACGDDDANNYPAGCVAPQIIDQDIDADQTWVTQGADCVDYRVTIEAVVSARLDIKPGITVLFEEEAGLKFNSPGHLVAEGSADAPITMLGSAMLAEADPRLRKWRPAANTSN